MNTHILTKSVYKQMVVDQKNMKASVSDVYALVYEGEGEHRRLKN